MTALSFFSYKGGVGRTLALTNLAMQLAEFGKSVFILDFDLEAPGVPYKLLNYITPDKIQTGVVDYIYEFSSKGQIDELNKYVISLPKNNPEDAPMWFLPAGNSNINEYWNKLSRIDWHNMFYTEGGKGLRFFLDLKEKIRKQYNPDFILIDSRTGITELSGISLKVLADEVVVLFVYNNENVTGTKKVLSFLYNDAKQSDNKTVKPHLVLTRVPNYPTTDKIAFNKEYKLLTLLKQEFATSSNGVEHEISVVHTDPRLETNEQLAFSRRVQENSSGIYLEHIQLFEKIFKDKLAKDEWLKQENKSKAQQLFNKTFELTDHKEQIKLLSEAIELNSEKWEYYFQRADHLDDLQCYSEALADLEKALKLNGDSVESYKLLALVLREVKRFDDALNAIEKSLSLSPNDLFLSDIKASVLASLGKREDALQLLDSKLSLFPGFSDFMNTKANILRHEKKYDEALAIIGKAIQIQPKPRYYGTLAEIYADQGKLDEFYLNLATTLSLGAKVVDMRDERELYQKFRTDPRFIEFLRSYNINSEDIFHDGPIGDNQQSFDISGDDLVQMS